jgi:hypothetical protein
MEYQTRKPTASNPFLRKGLGAVVSFRRESVFLEPGQTYRDPRGRLYKIEKDGSIRRIKNETV